MFSFVYILYMTGSSVFMLLRDPGPSWDVLGAISSGPGLSWMPLGACWTPLGANWTPLGVSWEGLGASWGDLGAVFGFLGAVLWVMLPQVNFHNNSGSI